MKYLCFLAYMFINLVNCRFFVTSDYSLQKQVQYILFLFLCSRFHKAEITSRRSLYYVGTYLLLRRDVFYQLTQISRQAEGYIYLFTFIYSVGVMPYSLEKHLEK